MDAIATGSKRLDAGTHRSRTPAETLARIRPLMARFGIEDFALRARAKAEYSRNRLIRPGDVTPDQRARIYDAFAETLEVSGIRWEA